uniref:Uncharacterized protein n=1 Tax=Oreochromis niloticus TaxID=8128 RepID=I3J2P7_ORENI
MGFRAFNRVAPHLWNALPNHIQNTNSLPLFITSLKTHLFKLAYSNSHKILEELLNQGIIPKEQHREKSSRVGEAYSIMLDDNEGARRRPPARLESLKMKKAQILHTREELEEKIRLAEERRKVKKAGKRERREEGGDHRGEAAEREVESSEKEEEEEMTQVEEFTASGELECDSSFQHADDKEEVF